MEYRLILTSGEIAFFLCLMECFVVEKCSKCRFEPPKNSVRSLYSFHLLAHVNKVSERRSTELKLEVVLQMIYKVHRIYHNVLDLLTLNQYI